MLSLKTPLCPQNSEVSRTMNPLRYTGIKLVNCTKILYGSGFKSLGYRVFKVALPGDGPSRSCVHKKDVRAT